MIKQSDKYLIEFSPTRYARKIIPLSRTLRKDFIELHATFYTLMRTWTAQCRAANRSKKNASKSAHSLHCYVFFTIV